MRNFLCTLALVCTASIAGSALVGCSAAPSSESSRASLVTAANEAVSTFESNDPSLAGKIADAYAYAVFPDAGKGGFIIGGGGAHGVVYRNGSQVGWAGFTTVTIGAQIGGQGYSMLILFQNQAAFDNFKAGGPEGSATASGVAVEAGASENADYRNGVMIFTDNMKGLMGEASVGGSTFNYMPLD